MCLPSVASCPAEPTNRILIVDETYYEHPVADDAVVSALREALADVPDLGEAYLISRRSAIDGDWQDDGLGVMARVGGRWRSPRRQLAALREALRPFYPPPFETAPLGWGHFGNSPVPEEARAVGVPLGGHS